LKLRGVTGNPDEGLPLCPVSDCREDQKTENSVVGNPRCALSFVLKPGGPVLWPFGSKNHRSAQRCGCGDQGNGVLSDQRIERKEVGPPGAFDDLSDDQLERALRERFSVDAKRTFEPTVNQRQSPGVGKRNFPGQRQRPRNDPETAPAIQWAECRDKMCARIAASLGLFAGKSPFAQMDRDLASMSAAQA
jgi:hypothetical protein